MSVKVDLAVFLRKYWLVIVEAAAIAGIVAVLASFLVAPAYRASVRVLVVPREDALASGVMVNPKPTFAESQRSIMLTTEVLRQTVTQLHLDRVDPKASGLSKFMRGVRGFLVDALSFLKYGYVEHRSGFDQAVADLSERVETRVMEDANVIEITVTWDDPSTAAFIADELAIQYRHFATERQRGDLREQLSSISAEIESREEALRRAAEGLAAFDAAHGGAEGSSLEAADRAKLAVLQKRAAVADSDLSYWHDLEQSITGKLYTKQDQITIGGSAAVPTYPASPNRLLYAAVGLLVGVLVGLGVASVLDRTTRSVFTVDDVDAVTEGAVPIVEVDGGSASGHSRAGRDEA